MHVHNDELNFLISKTSKLYQQIAEQIPQFVCSA